MTITRTQAFALLEGLTDKSLTKGCLVQIPHMGAGGGRLNTPEPIVELWKQHPRTKRWTPSDYGSSFAESTIRKVIGHPVTLLDVLTKLDASEEWSSGNMLKNECKVLDLWRPFSFKTHLRDILEGAAWDWADCETCRGDGFNAEHNPNDPHENGCSSCPIQAQCDSCRAEGKIEVLKDEKVEALVEFLINLQLTK